MNSVQEVSKAYIYSINGPVIHVKGSSDFHMNEMVFVGKEKLLGEVVSIDYDTTIVQVYEVTTGLMVGEPVIATGKNLSVYLGPGIMGKVFDGIQRPLDYMEQKSGTFITRGLNMEALNPDKKWDVHMTVKEGDSLHGGNVIATVQETALIIHKVMVPPGVFGEVIEVVQDGSYKIHQTIVKIRDKKDTILPLKLVQQWPVRLPRPYNNRQMVTRPLVTGQRIIDTFFPIAKGGTAAIPGGFGTGKTMIHHQLAKWSDSDIIVYIGCGERGNEITEVLEEFSKLIDPKLGSSLMDRTVIIANTSNMPVASREASIYTGIAIAEYYRDMGYHVALMADSTSCWAEALREISGRLEEMPAEEGFPAYLPSRLAQFYERAGYVTNLNDTEGSISIIGAVSPQGGDFSEPVTQNTKRFIRCFWVLERELAYSRHYPAIDWLGSYSEYSEVLRKWYGEQIDKRFYEYRTAFITLLQQESKLMEMVKLIGEEVLADEQKLILQIAKVIRIGFLQQDAYHKRDTYMPITKQYKMMEVIYYLYEKAQKLIAKNIPISVLLKSLIFKEMLSIKYIVGSGREGIFEELHKKIDDFYDELYKAYEDME